MRSSQRRRPSALRAAACGGRPRPGAACESRIGRFVIVGRSRPLSRHYQRRLLHSLGGLARDR
jgi:hypothetical protein